VWVFKRARELVPPSQPSSRPTSASTRIWAWFVRGGPPHILFRIVLSLFTLVGVATVVNGAGRTVQGYRWEATAAAAEGRVVAVVDRCESDPCSRRRPRYPEVQFVTAAGRTVQFEGSAGLYPEAYRVGDRVAVLYDPSNPDDARLATWTNRWGGGPFEVLFGLFFVVFAVAGLVRLSTVGRRPPFQGTHVIVRERDETPAYSPQPYRGNHTIDAPYPPPKAPPPADKPRRGWLKPALFAAAVLIIATIAASTRRSTGTDAPLPPSAVQLASAKISCDPDESGTRLRDRGRTLIVDSVGTENTSGISLPALDCLLALLNTPDSVKQQIWDTPGLDGQQQGSWDGFDASWSYDPKEGIDLIVTAKP
jgi:Protein of unknown function (DUF3592)